MIAKLPAYLHLCKRYIQGYRIRKNEYLRGYDFAASTYQRWLDLMSKHTDNIIGPESVPFVDSAHILDFCCGTGYISSRISKMLTEKAIIDYHVTACDISPGMIQKAVEKNLPGVHYLCSDGMELLLKTATDSIDALFCGWAVYYFNHNRLFKEWSRVLKPHSSIAIIANCKGTLRDIEKIFVTVMTEDPDNVEKIMDVRFSIPTGLKYLSKSLKKFGFSPVYESTNEEKVIFKTAEDLLNWLYETGAIAGTRQIFKDYSRAEQKLINYIKKYRRDSNGFYSVNHKFISGIYKR
ncbi:MAG: methyltransferase domain-containing protein [Spirochaetes bacterium]|jgi:ubiquinone/menaquinone biosynthesis C-methylase UbiE|nr:methyltransferase domain-containing protein [Spirochaetota bacterium]